MVTLILFVLIFGVVVISHEFGHFLLAKANGIHVIEFPWVWARICFLSRRRHEIFPEASSHRRSLYV